MACAGSTGATEETGGTNRLCASSAKARMLPSSSLHSWQESGSSWRGETDTILHGGTWRGSGG